MTNLNINTELDKSLLVGIVGKAVYISSFLGDQLYKRASGHYFIDSIIFHNSENIEIGVCEYDIKKPIESVNVDESHIGYFHLDELEMQLLPLSNQ